MIRIGTAFSYQLLQCLVIIEPSLIKLDLPYLFGAMILVFFSTPDLHQARFFYAFNKKCSLRLPGAPDRLFPADLFRVFLAY